MSVVDKIMGAIAPPESDDQRAEATAKAREAARPGDWLSLILDHHDQIRAAFEACRTAEPSARATAMRRLALILNGHVIAEEIVIYPAMAKFGEKMQAGAGYSEQATAKMQMAELERLDPMTQEWMDKLEHIRGAVLHHVYEEESSRFIALKEKAEDQVALLERYREEFDRYMGGGAGDGRLRAEGESGATRPLDEPRSYAPGP